MNWLRVHIDLEQTDPSHIELALVGLGAVSIEFSDAANSPILEPAPGATPLWPTLRLSALFDAAIDETAIRLTIAGVIESRPMPAIRFEPVADRDWIENWQQTLRPMRFGRNLWICPTGSVCPDRDGIVIKMDPGLAFGSGSHPTTALCLDWLANSNDRTGTLLDYGCGSGILCIAALVLGADRALGVDIDDQAIRATRDNAGRNQVAERLDVSRPEEVACGQTFDRIVANILSGPLTELTDELRGLSRTGTRIALSGILTDQSEHVMAAYRSWVEFEPPINRDDWALLSGIVVAA